MRLIESWMPAFDVSARYALPIAARPEQVYEALLHSDFSRPWLVRSLMGLRLLPAAFRSPGQTWRRVRRGGRKTSLAHLDGSDFMHLEASPPREIVVGLTGRFWTLAAQITPLPTERFRDPLPPGLAQAVWNFEVTPIASGSSLATETRVRCADPRALKSFRRYWRVVAPGSGLIRLAIMRQIRREALARGG